MMSSTFSNSTPPASFEAGSPVPVHVNSSQTVASTTGQEAIDNSREPAAASQTPQIELFGITIDVMDMAASVQVLRKWITDSDNTSSSGCRYVVTPNVDHVVMYQENADLRAAYEDADLVLADGHPVVWASRLLKRSLPERVAGSELVPKLFDSFNESGNLRVFLLGAAEGVAEVASQNMVQKWPNVQTVGVYSPPMGFENDPAECKSILERISACKPDVVVVGLGAPKQELWVHQHYQNIDAKAALCVGATIDFLAGEKKRAPVWMQKSGLEWFHRMCSDPKRLVKRYSKDAWVFPQLVAQQWVADLRQSVEPEQDSGPTSK